MFWVGRSYFLKDILQEHGQSLGAYSESAQSQYARLGQPSSTLRCVVYVSHLFTAVSYVEDVREKAKHPRGLVRMQQQIIHDLCKLNDLRIDFSRRTRINQGASSRLHQGIDHLGRCG